MPESNTGFDPQRFVKQLTELPGVYQMYDVSGAILYVGKAKNLKKRVASYFRSSGLNGKTQALVERIAAIEVTVTRGEIEALILEQSLIKTQRPPYNILLRDDKSYPYIFISSQDEFPRISLHRGTKRKKGDYYGPFPNAGSVKDSLSFLQKTFRVRQCEDSVYRNRTRPCLQYQINRCTAPCVGLIDPMDYRVDLEHTVMYLKGEAKELTQDLANRMEKASTELEFEKAAQYRDQIAALRNIQTEQVVESGVANCDVIGFARRAGQLCVHLLFVRQGRIIGSKSYYPKDKMVDTDRAVLAAFIAQYYLADTGREVPKEIICFDTEDSDVLASALQSHTGRQISLNHNVRSIRKQWRDLATKAAEQNLSSRLANRLQIAKRYEALQEVFELDETPQRLECFDISHSSGEATVASCVVFDGEGPRKSDYRRFNIEGITAGDDYAAMAQALNRRYTRLQKGEGTMPDILLIDGGKGQLNKAHEVLAELGVNDVLLLGVAKGSTRKAGFETLIRQDKEVSFVLDSDSPALHLIQHIRDEAHRFAVTGHKQRRDKARRTSTLESIPGVGSKRRRELLRHFGGLQQVSQASVEDLIKVQGISRKLAEEIYSMLHND